MCIVFGVDDVIDDVTRTPNMVNSYMAVTRLIFELQHQTKAQNVGYTLSYLCDMINFR